MSVLALIPARKGSKGIPGKNFRNLGTQPLWKIAVDCAYASGNEIGFGCGPDGGPPYRNLVVSSDASDPGTGGMTWLQRPAELAQDDTPMIDVVKHALEQIPGPPDQIVILLQPTQPFRTPEHIRKAIALLQETGADSVVSVVELPLTHSPDMLCEIEDGRVLPWFRVGWSHGCNLEAWRVPYREWPTRRQDARPAYQRDGTVYAFRRKTVEQHGTIYGKHCRPLIIDPAETCELDTEENWLDVERRWKERV